MNHVFKKIQNEKANDLEIQREALIIENSYLQNRLNRAHDSLFAVDMELGECPQYIDEVGELLDKFFLVDCLDVLIAEKARLHKVVKNLFHQIHENADIIRTMKDEIEVALTEIRVYKNGFKTRKNGEKLSKIMKGWWYEVDSMIKFIGDYGFYGVAVMSFFDDVKNASDLHSDLFCRTNYYLSSENLNYSFAKTLIN